MSGNHLLVFHAIANFVDELNSEFGKQYRSLKLYSHLITKTTLVHEKAINKHIKAFTEFVVNNKDAIIEKDVSKIVLTKISYSNRVYIDMAMIFKSSDAETKDIIWNHLLAISALVDPTSNAKQILVNQNKKTGNFLENMTEKLNEHIDPESANPMEAISSIMKSGLFTELVQSMGSGLANGSLDINQMLNSVQSITENQDENTGDMQPPNDMFQNMLSSVLGGLKSEGDTNTDSGGSGEVIPDISGIMGMLGPMMNNMMNANKEIPDVSSMEKEGGE